MTWLVVPNNGATQHYTLPQSKSLLFHRKLHTVQSDTKVADRLHRHHCETVWLWVLHLPLPVWLVGYDAKRSSNLKSNAFLDQQASRDRFCFFLADKGEQFIHFCCAHFVWHGRFWQTSRMCLDPQRYCSVMHAKVATDFSQPHAIYIHLDCTLTHLFGVTLLFGMGCILCTTMHTTISLRACFCFSGSVLSAAFFTSGTCLHPPILMALPKSLDRIEKTDPSR